MQCEFPLTNSLGQPLNRKLLPNSESANGHDWSGYGIPWNSSPS